MEPGGLARWQITHALFSRAEAGDYHVLTSFATLSEVRRLKIKSEQLHVNELEIIKRMFRNEWIYIIDGTREIGELSQDLGAKYGIDVIDAIHLASAIVWRCDVLFSWDKPFVSRVTDNPCQGVALKAPFYQGQIELIGDPGPLAGLSTPQGESASD
ncbi:MAG: type II toxin-antitoxin system VapC family toxin [Dehalococcoidia bacterium]